MVNQGTWNLEPHSYGKLRGCGHGAWYLAVIPCVSCLQGSRDPSMPPPHVHMGTTLSNPRSLTSNLRPPPSALDPSSLLSPPVPRSPRPSPLVRLGLRVPPLRLLFQSSHSPLLTPTPRGWRQVAAGGAGELAAANGGWWHWFSRTAYSHRCADLSTVNTYAGLKMLAVKIMLAATLLGALGRWLIQRPASKNHACKVQGARPQSLRRNQRTANQPPLDQDGQWTTEHTSALCSSAVCMSTNFAF